MTLMNAHRLDTEECRQRINANYLADEDQVIRALIAQAQLSDDIRQAISARAADLVRAVRDHSKPTLMEKFLSEYGLSTNEGVALMCLAEALLRVPDSITMDELIEDKVCSGRWSDHIGRSKSSLINTTTWGLMIAGKLITPADKQNLLETLRSLVKRLGEPMVRTVAHQAMKEMGRQFILGRSIKEALKRAGKYEAKGYTYSYDMLGEAARTERDALRYFEHYSQAIRELKANCTEDDIRSNPGISVKLSALHPRYEYTQRERVLAELVPRTLALAKQAKAANMGFNIDAEEADRLVLSLDVIEAVLADPELADWGGFGVVVQAFGKRASQVIDWLYALATRLERRIMVRLVKGAYWDAEIKRAQVMGLDGFPVFTRKACSDVSYLACAKQLLGMTDRIYPQFATHNAHSVSAILEMTQGQDNFEFQRLHGMGESLHDTVLSRSKTRCRIYAPVGAHQDLLAYLVRRLLENGANSSFVNQIVDTRVTPEMIARDPVSQLLELGDSVVSQKINRPAELFGANRINARGWDFTDITTLAEIDAQRDRFRTHRWQGGPVLATEVVGTEPIEVHNPADPTDLVGQVIQAAPADIEQAIQSAQQGFEHWSSTPARERAECLLRVADLYETHAAELFALATREAGKTLPDGIAEVREAVDFARYYAREGLSIEQTGEARGIITCISPWNFPLAIFTGQVLAALAAGNVVLAKPAPQTVLMATRAVELMHLAGIPKTAIQLLPGDGMTVGTAVTSDPRIAGVCFTGSTATAQTINRVMAQNLSPDAPLIAETGGLNAMIVDSTALPEQVVRDVLASSFQSAGQRCSALRMLYLQKEIADTVLEMLFGAMEQLKIGNPWSVATDVGPVIDPAAKAKIDTHCTKFAAKGQLLKQLERPETGVFVAPAVIRLSGIEALEEEIFGPVLHVATFEAEQLDQVVDAINARGFGLTFGLHTRIDNRVNRIINRIKVGNTYVNRNQIGAVVGSQPFGGEGLSGTGPKAGGPHYLPLFRRLPRPSVQADMATHSVGLSELHKAVQDLQALQVLEPTARTAALSKLSDCLPTPLDAEPTLLPGPTGELNRLSCRPRGTVLCAGPDEESALTQAITALSQGNRVLIVTPKAQTLAQKLQAMQLPALGLNGLLEPGALGSISGVDAVACGADLELLRRYRMALATRNGALLPLITEPTRAERFVLERHLCIDTTAAGGNASLIAQSE